MHPVGNMSQLKPYSGIFLSPLDPVTLDRDLEYELEAILDNKQVSCHKNRNTWSHLVDLIVFLMDMYLKSI